MYVPPKGFFQEGESPHRTQLQTFIHLEEARDLRAMLDSGGVNSEDVTRISITE